MDSLMTGRLRGGIIGAGFFARFHADAWTRTSGVEIAAVADPERGRAAAFAERWGIPRVYDNAEEMLDRERPDFADIATRPETHLALVRAAAKRRVHVICQKPMAPSTDDCIAMVETCEAARVRLVIHENWRWQPWYREVHRLANQGRFGEIYHVGFRMRTGDGRGPVPYESQPYFRDMPRLLVYETAVHFLDTFRFLGGDLESVFCRARRLNPAPAIRGEDYALVQVRFASGAAGLIDANRISGPAPPPLAFGELVAEGTAASVRMDPGGGLWITDYGGPEAPHPFTRPGCGYKGDSVKTMQDHFVACLRTGEPAESEGREYLKTVAAVEACYRSAETGRPEAVR
jgi:predicted dehydrogenase